jgi:putative ABC transport system permease protein
VTGVILVNHTLARQYWNNDSPLGKAAIAVGGRTREIVGVVRDAYTENLDQREPTIYIAFRGTTIPKVLVTPAAAQAMAALASRIEPRARTQILPLQANVDRWFSLARVGAEIAGMLGIFALILATVGMSGVFAYVVQQRTKEIGVRMALGARPAQVVRLVLGGSSRAVFIGLGIGLAIALLGSRLLRNLLYGVSPLDPIAYLSVADILAVAALAASYVPARRASRVDPLQALRHD